MEYDEVAGRAWPSDDLKHLPGGAGAEDEQSVVGFDQADGVGDGMTNRLVVDAMAPS